MDARGTDLLRVRRFDRVRSPDGGWMRRALDDATQVLGLPPADKYRVDSAAVVRAPAPIYDGPSTLLDGDDSLALPVAGRTTKLKAPRWHDFAAEIGLPERAAVSANALASRAATAVRLNALPFEGSPLRRAERELGFRRAQLEGYET